MASSSIDRTVEDFNVTRFKVYGLLFGGMVATDFEPVTATTLAATLKAGGPSSSSAPAGGSNAAQEISLPWETQAAAAGGATSSGDKGGKSKSKRPDSSLGVTTVAATEKKKRPMSGLFVSRKRDPETGTQTSKKTAKEERAEEGGGGAKLEFTSGEKAVRVFYDEGLYKVLRLTARDTALDICENGAEKLGLEEFSFGLYMVQQNSMLRLLRDQELVLHQYDAAAAKGAAPQLMFMNKPRHNNLEMRLQVFKRWINWRCAKLHKPPTEDVVRDVRRGALLGWLAEDASGKKIKGLDADPSGPKKELQNLKLSMDRLRECGAVTRSSQVPIEALHGGSLEAIHTVLWSIFFSRSAALISSEKSEFIYFEHLLGWCRSCLAAYAKLVVVDDFYRSWLNGIALGALLHHHMPGAIKVEKMTTMANFIERLSFVFLRAKKHARLPFLIDPADVRENIRNIDELSIIIVVATWYEIFNETSAARLASTAVPSSKDGFTICRVHFEGFTHLNSLTIPLKPNSSEDQVRQLVSKKTRLEPLSFSLHLSSGTTPLIFPLQPPLPSSLLIRPI